VFTSDIRHNRKVEEGTFKPYDLSGDIYEITNFQSEVMYGANIHYSRPVFCADKDGISIIRSENENLYEQNYDDDFDHFCGEVDFRFQSKLSHKYSLYRICKKHSKISRKLHHQHHQSLPEKVKLWKFQFSIKKFETKFFGILTTWGLAQMGIDMVEAKLPDNIMVTQSFYLSTINRLEIHYEKIISELHRNIRYESFYSFLIDNYISFIFFFSTVLLCILYSNKNKFNSTKEDKLGKKEKNKLTVLRPFLFGSFIHFSLSHYSLNILDLFYWLFINGITIITSLYYYIDDLVSLKTFFLIYIPILLLVRYVFYLTTFIHPLFKFNWLLPSKFEENPNGLLTISKNPYPEDPDPENTLLLCASGTEGDIRPMKYYARMAAWLGVKTHLWIVEVGTQAMLDDLKCGNLLKFLPSFGDLKLSHLHYYKAVFQPHCENIHATIYSLSPPPQYIECHDLTSNAHGIYWILGKLTEGLTYVFNPHFYIGNLKHCSLPRSTDGYTLLGNHQQGPNGKKIGWLCGSDRPEVIPQEIRDKYEQIVVPYHPSVFKEYSKVYCHGGAGSVQTLTAYGCEVVICDPFLDRKYIKAVDGHIDLRDDYYVPSWLPFLGFLVLNGFDCKYKLLHPFAILGYLRSASNRTLRQAILIIGRMYTFLYCLYYYHHMLIAMVLSVPYLIDIVSSPRTVLFRRALLYGLWEYPIIACLTGRFSLILFVFAFFNISEKFLNDLLNWKRNRTSIIITKVDGFPMPFGHMTGQDNTNGEQFEGLFTDLSGFYNDFAFIAHPFKAINKDKIVIPVPFSPWFMKKVASRIKKGKYTAFFNCHTFILESIAPSSIFFIVYYPL